MLLISVCVYVYILWGKKRKKKINSPPSTKHTHRLFPPPFFTIFFPSTDLLLPIAPHRAHDTHPWAIETRATTSRSPSTFAHHMHTHTNTHTHGPRLHAPPKHSHTIRTRTQNTHTHGPQRHAPNTFAHHTRARTHTHTHTGHDLTLLHEHGLQKRANET